MSTIAHLIDQATRHAGLSRRALAAKAGVAPETVSRICNRGTGDFATVARLVQAAGLQLAVARASTRSSRRAYTQRLRMELDALCIAHQVRRLELLETGEMLVEFEGASERRRASNYGELVEALEQFLRRPADVMVASGTKKSSGAHKTVRLYPSRKLPGDLWK